MSEFLRSKINLFSPREKKVILSIGVGALLVTGLVKCDAILEAEQKKVNIANETLNTTADTLSGNGLIVAVIDELSGFYDDDAILRATFGSCSGDIPVYQDRGSEQDFSGPWVVHPYEPGGNDNPLAIIDESGEVRGYLPLSNEALIYSFPIDCIPKG